MLFEIFVYLRKSFVSGHFLQKKSITKAEKQLFKLNQTNFEKRE